MDDAEETKINVVFANKLQPTSFDKKSYQVFIKEYIKKYDNCIEVKPRALLLQGL